MHNSGINEKYNIAAALLSIADALVILTAKKLRKRWTSLSSAQKNSIKNLKQKKPLKQRRELMQFSYGPNSFENNNFLEYLVESNANLPNDW